MKILIKCICSKDKFQCEGIGEVNEIVIIRDIIALPEDIFICEEHEDEEGLIFVINSKLAYLKNKILRVFL